VPRVEAMMPQAIGFATWCRAMGELWASLIPLAMASALVPVLLIITIVLLRGDGGVRTAAAFVGGMTAVRLAQAVLFGYVLTTADAADEPSGRGAIASAILLALGILLYVTALREYVADEDPDAPPPKWLAMTERMSAAKAFALGAGVIVVSAKSWVFTLSAIAAIQEARVGRNASVLAFLLFVFAAQSLMLAAVLLAWLLPTRANAVLGAVSAWLEDNNRKIVIVIGVVFGTWFVLRGLAGLGVI
jgi:hypothetical protein